MTYTERLHKLIFEEPFFNYAIFCNTKEKAETVVKSLYELGFSWGPDVPLYKEDGTILSRFEGKRASKGICYSLNQGSTTIFCSRKEFYEKRFREILTFDDLFKDCIDNPDEPVVESKNKDDTIPKESEQAVEDTLEESDANETVLRPEENTVEEPSFFEETIIKAVENAPIDMNSVAGAAMKENKQQPQNTSATKFCDNCGKKIKVNAKFCLYCGSKQGTADTGVSEKSAYKDVQGTFEDISKPVDKTSNAKEQPENLKKDNRNESVIENNNETKVKEQDTILTIDTPTKQTIKEKRKQVCNIKESSNLSSENNIEKNQNLQKETINYNLSKLLGLRPNQNFSFGHKTYRFNKDGLRERCITQDIWVLCNDEMELLYMINHPSSIKVI